MKRVFGVVVAGLQVLVLGCVPSACTDRAVVEGQHEIAGELRALRTVLAESSAKSGSQTPARAFDRGALIAAMEPMRELLMALVRDMDGLQTRQTALTEELKRWSQLLAQSTTAGNAEEVSALVTRLQQLEAQMQQQDERHREMEGLLTKALDSTADRLEKFLERLEGMPAPAQPAGAEGQPAGPPKVGPGNTATPANANKSNGSKSNANKPNGNTPNGGGEQPLEPDAPNRSISRVRRSKTRDVSTWWLGIAGIALLAGGVFALWLGRENRVAVAAPPAIEEPPTDEGVEELWAAAALLGEAVGRLRQEGEPAANLDAANLDAVDLDDLVVIDESPVELPEVTIEETIAEPTPSLPELPSATPLPVTPHPTPPPRTPSTALPKSTAKNTPKNTPEDSPEDSPEDTAADAASGPIRMLVHLAVTDVARSMANVLAALERDPRVLRRPEPTVTASRGGLVVAFAVLPQLAMGERAHLELLVRAAII